jgi:hypothetical protein
MELKPAPKTHDQPAAIGGVAAVFFLLRINL